MIPGMPETLLPAKAVKSVKCQVQCTGLSSRHVRIFFFMLLIMLMIVLYLVTFSVFLQEQGELIQTLFLLANVPNPKGHDYHDFFAWPLKKYVFVIPPSEEQEKKKA